MLKEPEKSAVEELKMWLECHGLKKSGKKAELIIRVKDGLKLNLPVDPKIDGGKWYNLKTEDSASIENTSSKTSIASLGDLPTDGYRLFPSKNLPANFNYGHVYFYLVESAAKASNIPDSSDSDEDNLYDNCDTVTAKPLKKGRNLLSSGFVENKQDNFDEIKHEFYVRAHVQHSMKNMLPLNVNVVISDISGYVKVAMCDCKVSALGRCAHVAALLLKLSDAAHDKGSTIKAVHVTTRHMEGKKHDKKSQRLHEAEYSSSKRKPPSELYMWDLRPENKRCVKEDDIKNLVVDLQADNNPSMWVTLLSITYDDFKLEQSDITIYRNMAMQFFQEFGNHNLTILKSEISREIPDTQDQVKSDHWHSESKFHITASICKNIVNLGENLSEHDSLRPHFNWLEKEFLVSHPFFQFLHKIWFEGV